MEMKLQQHNNPFHKMSTRKIFLTMCIVLLVSFIVLFELMACSLFQSANV